MKIRGSGHALGATVDGLDLSEPLPDEARDAILRALGAHGVLRFPRQTLSGRQLADFSARSASSRRTSPAPTSRSPAFPR